MPEKLLAIEDPRGRYNVLRAILGISVILPSLMPLWLTAAEDPPIAVWVNPPKVPVEGLLHQTYHSTAMDTPVGYNIYLPPGYADSQDRFPVLYFLHGRFGNESSDSSVMKTLDASIRAGRVRPMILVYPSGGQHTVYCDSYDGKYLAETTIVRELIPHIDATFRTMAKREGRAIQGMSMGGCGAMQLGLKYPELFSSVVSYAGGFVSEETMQGRVAMINKAMFGGDSTRWLAAHPFNLARENAGKLKNNLALRVICGTTDISLQETRNMHAVLLETGLDHDYFEYAGIPHNFAPLIAAEGDSSLQFAARHFGE